MFTVLQMSGFQKYIVNRQGRIYILFQEQISRQFISSNFISEALSWLKRVQTIYQWNAVYTAILQILNRSTALRVG